MISSYSMQFGGEFMIKKCFDWNTDGFNAVTMKASLMIPLTAPSPEEQHLPRLPCSPPLAISSLNTGGWCICHSEKWRSFDGFLVGGFKFYLDAANAIRTLLERSCAYV